MKGIKFFFLAMLAMACASKKSLDPFADAFNSKHDLYRTCYVESDSYRGKDKIESGTVTMVMMVNLLGRVESSRITNSPFNDPNLHACLRDMVKRVKFPIPPKGKDLEITQFITFYPELK